MKGVVFNLLENAIVRYHGENVWDALLASAGVTGAYTSLGNYPDAEMGRLVGAASTKLGIAPNEVLRWFGRVSMPMLAEQYPHFFTPYGSTRRLLVNLNGIIHPEVRKIYPGADVPYFDYHDRPDGSIVLGYESPRRLCALAHGFVEGAADHFGEVVDFDHIKCVRNGDARCEFLISFAAGH